ncbi:NAS13-like protein [Mya arenaria]|uniref:Metalloendopeptidase n=1 Tax=Mya arenaria TaxID=6604 RepID=A0ABY7E0S7_MYAAR|nr:NAS13-like protein [Mya arenaria]
MEVSVITHAAPSSNANAAKLQSIAQYLDSLPDSTIFDYIFRVNKGAGLNLFEGDIKDHDPRHQVRTAITNHNQLWNTRVVPYIIDPVFDSAGRKEITSAIDEYHQKTCIKWVPRTSEKDYVHFKQISGCFSNIGRTGGMQEISLTGYCLKKGSAVHEMMHALGFWHEQSRPDRDGWVHVITSNVEDGKEYNFEKLTTTQADTLGVSYDYGSVMHYSKYAFSKNGNPTIMPTNPPSADIGQRDGLSDSDVLRITKLYGCGIPSPTQSPTTTAPPQTKPPQTKPTQTKPPQTQPPRTQPPQTQSPKTQPPQTQPPKTQPPQTQPPKTQPPQTQPPKTQPPQTQPAKTQLPQTQPAQTQPPQTQPPQTKPAQTQPPATQLPQTQTPATQPPQTQPPQTQPAQTQPAQTQPAQTLPPPQTFAPVHQMGWTYWSHWSTCDLKCSQSRYRVCLNYDITYCPGPNVQDRDCGPPCKASSHLGCWHFETDNITVPTVEGNSLELSDNYKDREDSVRKCGDYAATHGYPVFALYDGGMCLTGPYHRGSMYGLFGLLGVSNKCDNGRVGGPSAVSLYSFQAVHLPIEPHLSSVDIDGGWSAWSGFGRCTRTCGMGRQYRYRRCDNPPPVGNGAPCVGSEMDTAICNQGSCITPIKCGTKLHAGGPGSSGVIWVRDYKNFMECEYQIATGDRLASISLYFFSIDIEYSKGCIYDALMLFDGHNTLSPLVASLCGRTSQGTFESSGNRVYMKFVSDETQTAGGFTIFYTINSRSRKACVKPPVTAHAVMTLEGNMVGQRAWFTCNPGYHMVGHSPITCVDQPGFALWDNQFPFCVNKYKRSADNEVEETSCTFEDSLCGFENDKKNDLDWKVKLPMFTGNDTATGVNGNFLQAESSRLQAPGDRGRVATIVLPGSDGHLHCAHFSYRIDGSELISMTVYQRIEGGAENATISMAEEDRLWPLMMEKGSNDLQWKQASLLIESSQEFQIVFEAAVGSELGTSVAIDNVRVSGGACSVK